MSFLGDIKGTASDNVDRLMTTLGFGHSEAKLDEGSQGYWTGEEDDAWRNNTHIQSGSAFEEMAWEKVGQDHLMLFNEMSRGLTTRGTDRIVEWGVGGGSNAVAFAPLAKDFIGVDLKREILDEAGRQVSKHTETPFTPVLIPVAFDPLSVDNEIGPVDLFLCVYVLELVPSPKYGLEVMQTAYQMLQPGGLAFVQIKYDTGSWRTRSRGRRYRGSVAASMTSYPIHEFWQYMTDIGFEHAAGVHLVPQNELDERYAYYLLRKPWNTTA